MPTYDYRCQACGHTFDELQSFSEPPLTKCPACKKNKLERLFGGGGAIIFKGSGFYETDYRSESYKQAAKAEQDSGAGKNGTADKTGADGTPAPKSESAGETKAKAGGKSPKSAS